MKEPTRKDGSMTIEDNTPEVEKPTPRAVRPKSKAVSTIEVGGDSYTPLQEDPKPEDKTEPTPSQETAKDKADRLYGDRYTIESVSESGNIGNATVTHQGTRYIFSFPLKEDD